MKSLTAPLLVAAVVSLLSAACKKDPPPPPAPPPPPPAEAPAPAAAEPAPSKPAVPVNGRIEMTVTEAGFVPDTIAAKADQPLTLAITRKHERTCATEIIFAGQEGKTDLPLNKTVEVVYTPKKSGPIKFGCAMGMMIGGVINVD